MASYTIGVVADTHVPDRRRKLHPALLAELQLANVQQILHAGDITLPRILRELENVAPVTAVRGNRDWFGFRDLPLTRVLDIQGKRIGLTHGHGGLALYLQDKARYLLRGPQSFSIFTRRAQALVPADVDVVIFGHTHAGLTLNLGGKLVLNPGSACCPVMEGVLPSFALLHIQKNDISAEIVYLP